MPESPRYTYRQGKHEEARSVFARLAGVPADHSIINSEITEIEEREAEERSAGKAHWTEIFTGPGMLHRTLLGMALQAGQQLTGANFFFYYSTTIFKVSYYVPSLWRNHCDCISAYSRQVLGQGTRPWIRNCCKLGAGRIAL